MKKLIFILSISFCLKTFGQDSLFIQANNKYSEGIYEGAISLYDSILSSGVESSELFYNTGNCYYKQQDWANAIWHYEKSLKLNSKNKNALHNLQITQLKIIDQIESIPQLFYQKWWQNIISSLSTNTWQILAILCIWGILIIQLIRKLKKFNTRYLLNFLSLLTVILFYITYYSHQEKHTKNEAIIFSSTVVVNSAPTNNSTNLFSLHSGTKIEIVEHIGNWINIILANGNSGWIKESECKMLN
jgi:tetratricopeptide (TPR) repeat protein